MNYRDNELYDLMEKKERAKTNLKWFFGFGIIGVIFMCVIVWKEIICNSVFSLANMNFPELIIVILTVILMFLMGIDGFGGIPIGVRLIFKLGFIPLNFYTLGLMVSIGAFIGAFVSPYIVIRDIYYLAKKY